MIYIVFGKPGVGKSSFLAAVASTYLDFGEKSLSLLQRSRELVAGLNEDAGGKYKLPTVPPVYSNFPIRLGAGTNHASESLYIDGFRLGFENDLVEVIPVFPGSVLFLAEAQRYYNSRKSTGVPDWVSRYYEEHRHFDLTIFMDCQRPGLIDLNIRELVNEYIEITDLRHVYDDSGNIAASEFSLRRFTDWKFVDEYLKGSDGVPYEDDHFYHEGNIFEIYESKSYFKQFVPATAFSLRHHPSAEELKNSAVMDEYYSQTAPPGFYPEKKR